MGVQLSAALKEFVSRRLTRGELKAYELVVTPTGTTINFGDDPALGVTIANDGPGYCYFRVNNGDWGKILENEQIYIDFFEKVISSVSLRAPSGGSPTVRLFAKK